ncbi:RNA polymerase sigma factor [Microbacterium sp.]|uniref:RNA polymerase sigma factor n=1 Tax=Microbacterium sp. TaxID=51671 RepID=UPI0039E50A4F
MDRQQTFHALFDAHYVAVLRYIERRVADDQVAQEIAADVFEALWRKLDVDEPQGLPWLYTTAGLLVKNQSRSSLRRASAEAALQRRVEEPPADADRADDLALRVALGRLDEREREAIELTYWEGLSAHEAGAVLGMRPGAVWTLLSRVRARLRRELEAASAPARSSAGEPDSEPAATGGGR